MLAGAASAVAVDRFGQRQASERRFDSCAGFVDARLEPCLVGAGLVELGAQFAVFF